MVFPHADDEMTVAGLISHLKEKGADIRLLTLINDREEPKRRAQEHACASGVFGIDHFEMLDTPSNSWDSAFSAHSLFQMTLTEDLETFLVKGRDSYDLALERTGSTGLPEPEVALDIQSYWKTKNEAGHCYESQAKTLRNFHMIVGEDDFEEHRKAFSHEYYTVKRK